MHVELFLQLQAHVIKGKLPPPPSPVKKSNFNFNPSPPILALSLLNVPPSPPPRFGFSAPSPDSYCTVPNKVFRDCRRSEQGWTWAEAYNPEFGVICF